MKEKIAKALKEIVLKQESATIETYVNTLAEAILPIIEAEKQALEIELMQAKDLVADYKGENAELKAKLEAPIEFVDCGLSPEELGAIADNAKGICEVIQETSEAQLEKCRGYIEAYAEKEDARFKARIVRGHIE